MKPPSAHHILYLETRYLACLGLVLSLCLSLGGCGGKDHESVNGRGFLIFSESDGSYVYSDEANLRLSAAGLLVSETGLALLSFPMLGSGALEPIYTIIAETVAEKSLVIDHVVIDSSGKILVVAEYGERVEIGNIALADFQDPSALSCDIDSFCTATPQSGEASLGIPGRGNFGTLEEIRVWRE